METAKEKETGLQVNSRIGELTGFKPEEVGVIKNTVAKGTTDTELAYFLSVCKQVQLNPFLKQIWCYKDKSGNLLVFAGRDGYLEIAQRDTRWTGMLSSYVCANDTFSMDVPAGKVSHSFPAKDRGEIIGAYCIIKPKGLEMPTVEWASMDEYKPKNASAYSPWSNTPGIMIQKVAEVHALKKAYGISGLQSEYDFGLQDGVVIPVQQIGVKPVIDSLRDQIIVGLDEYTGEDAEALKEMCVTAMKENRFTEEFARNIASQIKLELK